MSMLFNVFFALQLMLQAIAKRVETLTVINPYNASKSTHPQPHYPQAKLFHPAFAIQTKEYQHWKRGEGRDGHWDFVYEVEDEF